MQSARADILNDQQGDFSLGRIALRNGFPDSSSLSHAFKAVYGFAPSQLRRGRKSI